MHPLWMSIKLSCIADHAMILSSIYRWYIISNYNQWIALTEWWWRFLWGYSDWRGKKKTGGTIKKATREVKKIKGRNKDARTKSMYRQMNLNEKLQPRVQATREQTAELKASLAPKKRKEMWDRNNALHFYIPYPICFSLKH